MDLKKIMKHIELFSGLTDAQLDEITAISHREVHPGNTTIFEQGSTGDALYVIGNGQVEIQVRTSQGESFAAIYLGTGQVFGEMALVDQGPRSASIVTVDDDTEIFKIPTTDFNRLCQSNTDIGYVMMRNIAQDLSFKLRHRDVDPSKS